ncbi:MAG TPA: delta-60 repeat domain-containing protein, partial [Flavisolibacter sp.]|nr:delta-60 repeat domain-containing protein [Flavisolibacter sp.]
GTLDTSFDLDGIVTTSFGASTTQNASSVALQSDGKIVVGGSSQNQFALVRYNSDGSLDTSFDTDGKLTTTINASGTSQINSLVLQSNGSIVAAGRYSYYDFMTDANAYNVALARYTSSGALDTNFDADGKLTFVVSSFNPLDEAKSVTVQSDGKMLVTGTGFTVARLNSNGSFDNSFDNDGKVLGTNGSVVKLWTNRVYVGNASGGLGLSAFQNDFTALPLRLVAFHATAKNSQVVLSWQTAAEQNTKNFKVERSADGVHYLTIGDVKAAGNSPEMSYLFTDAGPLAGKNFYRLKMMDNDGRFTFSNVLAVTVETEQQLFLPANRVAGRLPVYLRGEGSALLHIVDATGKILAQERLFLNGNKTHEVAVQALPAGQYFLLLQTKDHQEVKPFFKQ